MSATWVLYERDNTTNELQGVTWAGDVMMRWKNGGKCLKQAREK